MRLVPVTKEAVVHLAVATLAPGRAARAYDDALEEDFW